ncbi:hypothetical protein B296_00038094 [Ensete ventricosum]|uniref:Uncharacterized protein n=1 Tax=Ensete ventricosum TaxID=4639 RepID=A0A426ZK42_ENSVE|nr:hypothetical protein B296_00038094 [Ensete ventricosum]
MSTSAPAAQEDVLRPASPPPPPPSLLPPHTSESCGELVEPSVSGLTQAVPFSSGNPRIEETRGIMHLYPEDATYSSTLPVRLDEVDCRTGIGLIPHILLVKLYLFFILNAERLDQDTGGILTTICNHTFHCSCISKWADSSCPVSDIFCIFELLNSF